MNPLEPKDSYMPTPLQMHKSTPYLYRVILLHHFFRNKTRFELNYLFVKPHMTSMYPLNFQNFLFVNTSMPCQFFFAKKHRCHVNNSSQDMANVVSSIMHVP